MGIANKGKVIKELKSIVGDKNVLSSPEALLCYSYDGAPVPSRLPDIVAIPSSTDDVQKIVKFASANGIRIIPRGAGTGLTGGSIPVEGGIVIPFTRMNRILEIDSENLMALVEPGVVTGKLCSAVEEKHLFYPPDPASFDVCTIGGNVGENAGGLRGRKYGVTKDYVSGLEMVLANGDVITTGGKSRKNVAGYDLTSLMVGSEGTLAIITKILLRLLPLPETKKTLLASFRRGSDATSCISDILSKHRIIPATLEFLDKTVIKCVNDFVGNILPADADSVLLIEVDGSKASCEEDADKIKNICQQGKAITVQLAKDAKEADTLTLARRSAWSALSSIRPTTILEDATVPSNRLGEMLNGITLMSEKYNVPIGVFGHAGDGNLHPSILTDERDSDEMKRVHKIIAEIFELAVKLGGTITGEHGVGISKMDYLPLQFDYETLQVMRSIKHTFDPNNMLNPGKIFLPERE